MSFHQRLLVGICNTYIVIYLALQEMYRQGGQQFGDELQRHQLRASQVMLWSTVCDYLWWVKLNMGKSEVSRWLRPRCCKRGAGDGFYKYLYVIKPYQYIKYNCTGRVWYCCAGWGFYSAGHFWKSSCDQTWSELGYTGLHQDSGFWWYYSLTLNFFLYLQFKEINARFEKIEPLRNMFDKQHSSSVQCITPPNRFSAPANQNKAVAQQAVTNQHWPVSELKVPVPGGSTRGNSPKLKLVSEGSMSPILSIFRNGFSKCIWGDSLCIKYQWSNCKKRRDYWLPSTNLVISAGDSAMVEKPADPIRVFSEKDLAKEFEKAASMLAPAQDWSIRMSAMQRIEGIVAGGTCYWTLRKWLVCPFFYFDCKFNIFSEFEWLKSTICWVREWLWHMYT